MLDGESLLGLPFIDSKVLFLKCFARASLMKIRLPLAVSLSSASFMSLRARPMGFFGLGFLEVRFILPVFMCFRFMQAPSNGSGGGSIIAWESAGEGGISNGSENGARARTLTIFCWSKGLWVSEYFSFYLQHQQKKQWRIGNPSTGY